MLLSVTKTYLVLCACCVFITETRWGGQWSYSYEGCSNFPTVCQCRTVQSLPILQGVCTLLMLVRIIQSCFLVEVFSLPHFDSFLEHWLVWWLTSWPQCVMWYVHVSLFHFCWAQFIPREYVSLILRSFFLMLGVSGLARASRLVSFLDVPLRSKPCSKPWATVTKSWRLSFCCVCFYLVLCWTHSSLSLLPHDSPATMFVSPPNHPVESKVWVVECSSGFPLV